MFKVCDVCIIVSFKLRDRRMMRIGNSIVEFLVDGSLWLCVGEFRCYFCFGR